MLPKFTRWSAHAIRFAVRVAVVPVLLSACHDDNSTAPAAAANITVTTGAAQTATVGTALGTVVVVQVTDGNGNPMSGVVVQFAPVTGDGATSLTTVAADASGSAGVVWTLGNTAGTDSLVVTAGGLSTTITATATAGAPAQVTIVSGNNQAAPADSVLAAPLVVKVTDQFGNAVPNVAVQWSDSSGGVLSSNSVMTDANGLAQVGYTMGAGTGQETVIATVSPSGGSAVSADFTEQAQ